MRATTARYVTQPDDPHESVEDRIRAAIRAAARELRERQLLELRRMRLSGMTFIERLERSAKGELEPSIENLFRYRSQGIIRDFCTAARAVRQTLLLEQEIEGIRRHRRDPKPRTGPILPPLTLPRLPSPFRKLWDIDLEPLKDDLEDMIDYRPVGEAVDFIRQALRLDAPADDPFPPPPRPRAGKPSQAEAEPPAADEAEAGPADPEKPQSRPRARKTAQKTVFPKPPSAIRAPAEAEIDAPPTQVAVPASKPGPTTHQPPRGPP